MDAQRPRGKRAIAADIWRLMTAFTSDALRAGGRLDDVRKLGLTPGHIKALMVLDPDEPRPMRALADSLACDASTVTWLADGLEERGLVERRALPNDRRVKTLVLTSLGGTTRQRLTEAMLEPPQSLCDLDAASLEQLRELLRRLPEPERPFWAGAAPQRPPVPAKTS